MVFEYIALEIRFAVHFTHDSGLIWVLGKRQSRSKSLLNDKPTPETGEVIYKRAP